ncbi:L,D-transpeptidase family protein [Paenibacillus hamazuiensis]|uniref:L,D-transpeptidase family protein n=1 Tax=Paenibacillus hamazuiensis TaxID=2936508 RepID=UPI00200D6F6D|nr:L,D-transpeptidase family protein [Paenibacillus hamazuiensis]
MEKFWDPPFGGDQLGLCEQVISVEAEQPASFRADLKLFEKSGEVWTQTMGPIPVAIGRSGIAADKTEGDGTTPAGCYELGESFGTKPAPEDILIRYRKVTDYDYWIDDTDSDDYNRWVYHKGNPSDRWKSFERLTDPLYSHAIIVKYNMEPVVKGKGSAIFIHEWKNEFSPTAGCVAMSYDSLVRLMKRIDPRKKPKIVIAATVRA